MAAWSPSDLFRPLGYADKPTMSDNTGFLPPPGTARTAGAASILLLGVALIIGLGALTSTCGSFPSIFRGEAVFFVAAPSLIGSAVLFLILLARSFRPSHWPRTPNQGFALLVLSVLVYMCAGWLLLAAMGHILVDCGTLGN